MLKDWFGSMAEREASRDRLKTGERIGQAVGIAIILLVIAFFLFHQMNDTGFFSDAFGPLEMALFYSVPVLGLAASTLRLIFARKNLLRPLDIAGMVIFIFAALYFLDTFPFDFSHLADPLPGLLKWTLSWIDDGIARIFLVIGVICSIVGAGFTTLSYLLVMERLGRGE